MALPNSARQGKRLKTPTTEASKTGQSPALPQKIPIRMCTVAQGLDRPLVAMFTSGNKDQYKHLVCVHAAHECDAIEEIFISGYELGALDADGHPLSSYFSSEKTEPKTETLNVIDRKGDAHAQPG